jgi:hypothetical protein
VVVNLGPETIPIAEMQDGRQNLLTKYIHEVADTSNQQFHFRINTGPVSDAGLSLTTICTSAIFLAAVDCRGGETPPLLCYRTNCNRCNEGSGLIDQRLQRE